jgi:dTDP-4-amino-4,6-dideoxygalactose transaminase
MDFVKVFAEHHSFDSFLFGTRATGLLYALLKVENYGNPTRTKVLLPSITCTSLVHSCLAAGLTPIFYDCVESDLNGDSRSAIDSLLKYRDELALLVAIHQFGNWNDSREAFKLAASLGVRTLEDRCQLLNPELPDQDADYVLFSFGSTKTLNCQAGAALCSRKNPAQLPFSDIARIVKKDYNLASRKLAISYKSDWYEFNRSNGYLDLTSQNLQFEKYKEYLLWGAEKIDFSQISARWNLIEELNSARKSLSSKFELRFRGFEQLTSHSDKSEFSVPWRYVVSLPTLEIREDIVKQLRNESLHVSTWYVSLKSGFPLLGDYSHTVADQISTRLLNFWVDENTQDAYVNDVARVLSLNI